MDMDMDMKRIWIWRWSKAQPPKMHLMQAVTAWWIVMECGVANMHMLLLDGMPTVRS